MLSDFHFLRPWWFTALLPLIFFVIYFFKQKPMSQAWAEVCDSHLLEYLIEHKGKKTRNMALPFLFCSIFFIILSCAGPCWIKLPVATYKPILPRVLILDMSDNMLQSDLTPSRLTRAKFILHDILKQKNIGQFGFVVFTGESFVVSPLTEDGSTIDALLDSLTTDIMPVGGRNLVDAMKASIELIKTAGYKTGELLILTADSPSKAEINFANKIAQNGIHISLMPMKTGIINPAFSKFVQAGKGKLLPSINNSKSLQSWLNSKINNTYILNEHDEIPQWKDEGRWLLLPAFLFLLILFQRGRLQQVGE